MIKRDKHNNARQKDSIDVLNHELQMKIFIRFTTVQVICGILATFCNVIIHGITPAIIGSAVFVMTDLVNMYLSCKFDRPVLGTYLGSIIHGFIHFPFLMYMTGTSSIPYLFIVIVTIGYIVPHKVKHLAIAGLTAFDIGVILVLRNISPAWKALPQDGYQSTVISFVLVGISLYLLELVFLKQYQEYNNELRRQSDAKTEFLARMSHEIRTPINGIIGMNEMIMRECDNDDILKYASNARSSGKILLGIINDILDISKIEAGKMETVSEKYKVSEIVQEAASIISSAANNKGLTFTINADENMPSRLYGDEMKISQVILNLLSNSVKYTEKGEIILTIGGKLTADNKFILHVSVKDTGSGIKEEDKTVMFEAFERVNLESTRKIQGTGLGLNITSKLVELMGGKLQVESEYGKGSEFFFDIPQGIGDSRPLGIVGTAANRLEIINANKTFKAPDAKVLVIDDNLMNLDVFEGLLKRTEIKVSRYESGEECLRVTKEEKFNVIFLDHMMPKMDGVKTLELMNASADNINKDTPVIALTANAISGAKEMYLNYGFDNFLTKPINAAHLEEMLRKYIPAEMITEVSSPLSALTETDSILPEVEGFDFNYAKKYTQDEEIILFTLRQFKDSIDGLIAEIRDSYADIDNDESKDFCRVKVHALKGICDSLGQLRIHFLAREAEGAINDNNMTRIHVLVPILLEEASKCSFILKNTELNTESDEGMEPYDPVILRQQLVSLRSHMETFDFDAADGVIESIRSYSYADIGDIIDEIKIAEMNLDVDTVIALCDNLLEGMQE